MIPAEKKTVYRPVVSLHGGTRHERPVHLERVDMCVIGRTYQGDKVWSEYPKNRALCGVRDLMSTPREADCAKCLKRRAKQEDWNGP